MAARTPDMRTILAGATFALLAVVVGWVLVRVDPEKLQVAHTWLVATALGGMLVLLALDRLIELSVTAKGLTARLREEKADAIREVEARTEPRVAETFKDLLSEVHTPEAVEALRGLALRAGGELNIDRILDRIVEAIRSRRTLRILYRPVRHDDPADYHVAPLDVQAGRTDETRSRDYLWAFSFDKQGLVSLSLGRIVDVEVTSESFDPDSVTAKVGEKKRFWNIARDW